MKSKKIAWLFLAIVLIIISTYYGIKSLTATNHGKLDTTLGVVTKISSYFNPVSLKGKSISEMRSKLHNYITRWDVKSIPFSNITNMNINTSSNQIPVRIYTPDKGSSFPIIIYVHGGAWVGGSLDDYGAVCRKISKNTNAIVISVAYRLAPENPFPAGLDDVYNVLLWVHKNSNSINGNSTKICVAGDSAGGNLAAAVCQMARDKSGPHINSEVLIYPATNLYSFNTKSWSYYGGAGYSYLTKENYKMFLSYYIPKVEDRKKSYASPLLSNDFSKLPDTLIITAEFDPLRDEGEEYGNKLRNAGVNTIITRYNGVTHGFISMGSITKKSNQALDEISAYLREQFSKS